MPPKFTISMLALDGIELSRACITSILKHSTPGLFHLFLTNNGSKDGTKEYFDDLAASHPCITVIHNAVNECFIKPNNHAFELGRQMGATYHMTINNDLVVPEKWLELLEAEFIKHPKAAVVGPQGTISHMNHQMLGFSREKLEFIEGSLMCVRVAYVEKFGPLFSDYLVDIYHDDSDLSLRMQRAGYTIHQAAFHVEHRNGTTCTRHPEAVARCRAANAKNQRTMMIKWAHWNRVRCFNFPILVRRRFAVGDALLTTPVIKALKELWPLCPIDVETNSPEIFAGNPNVRTAGQRIALTAKTMVVNLDGAYERTPSLHVLECYAKAAGVHPLKEPKLELYPDGEAPIQLTQGRWCAVHIGPTTWESKNWPFERWEELCRWLREEGFKIVLLGDRGTPVRTFDFDMRGQKGPRKLAAALQKCALFVGLDSFPAHAASAMNVPRVVLFGITDPDCFAVRGEAYYAAVRSAPTHPDTGRRNRTPNVTFIRANGAVMSTISIQQVKDAVSNFLILT
jgi:ADP-heptose:LPS heptosyltransferase